MKEIIKANTTITETGIKKIKIKLAQTRRDAENSIFPMLKLI